MTAAQAHDLARQIANELEDDFEAIELAYDSNDAVSDVTIARAAVDRIAAMIQAAVNAQVAA